MGNTTVYPFSRPIIYDQKSEQEQQQYAENQNRAQYNPNVVPADYRPVMTTDKPIQGVSDEKTLSKPSISVIEVPEEVTITTDKVSKTYEVKQGYWGTVFATAAIVTVGYFVYTKFLTKRK